MTSRIRRLIVVATLVGGVVATGTGIVPSGSVSAHGCVVTANVNVIIRTQPRTQSGSLGTLVGGTTVHSNCASQQGGYYSACGGGSYQWVKVYSSLGTGYVADNCVAGPVVH